MIAIQNNKIHTVIIDGATKVRESAIDLDGDGTVGGIETVSGKTQQQPSVPQESTEMDSVMEKAFPSRQTDVINMLGNIKQFETNALFIIRSLVRLQFLPFECIEIAEEYIELSISRDARGRNDLRDISVGKKQFDAQTSKVNNFMGMNR